MTNEERKEYYKELLAAGIGLLFMVYANNLDWEVENVYNQCVVVHENMVGEKGCTK